MKKLLLFVFCILFFTTTNALAVEIAWMHVQHREYGSGKSFNRLGFGLIDDRGYYITNNKNIIEIKLFNADKKELKLSEVKFDSVEEVSGSYDYKNSQWYYSKGWQFDSWFSAGILDSLSRYVLVESNHRRWKIGRAHLCIQQSRCVAHY